MQRGRRTIVAHIGIELRRPREGVDAGFVGHLMDVTALAHHPEEV